MAKMDEQQALSELKDGTKASGFVHGKENKPPRQCGNCIWMGMGSCGHPMILADPENTKRNDFDRFPVDEDDCSDFFQSQGNVLLWIVRHGATTTDLQGKHGGWQNDPLSDQGRSDVQKTKKFLDGKKFNAVYSSDMSRAIETAKIVSGKEPETDKALRSWDVGVFTGKDTDLYKKHFEEFLKHPSRQIPDGESFAEFSQRMLKALRKYIALAREKGPILIVCHSRNFSQFKAQIQDTDEFEKPESWDKVAEGGVMVVLNQNDKLKVEIVFNRGDDGELSFAS